jgi:hypothetical protein
MKEKSVWLSWRRNTLFGRRWSVRWGALLLTAMDKLLLMN